jgi:hypothetical protein
MQYVLVGGPFEIVDTPHKIEVWGQPVEIPDDLARGAILEGAHLLPKDQFDALGFPPEQVAKYPNARLQTGAPADFQQKHAAALQAAREYRAQLQAGTRPKDKS